MSSDKGSTANRWSGPRRPRTPEVQFFDKSLGIPQCLPHSICYQETGPSRVRTCPHELGRRTSSAASFHPSRDGGGAAGEELQPEPEHGYGTRRSRGPAGTNTKNLLCAIREHGTRTKAVGARNAPVCLRPRKRWRRATNGLGQSICLSKTLNDQSNAVAPRRTSHWTDTFGAELEAFCWIWRTSVTNGVPADGRSLAKNFHNQFRPTIPLCPRCPASRPRA